MRVKGIQTTLAALMLVSALAFAADVRYTKVTVSADGCLTLYTADGQVLSAPLDQGQAKYLEKQVGFEKPQISSDQRTVGWLSLYPNCCTSYPIPLELVLFREGAVVQRLRGNGQPIWAWRFDASGRTVALTQRPTHGAAPDHYELHDIATGKLIGEYDHDEGEAVECIPS